MKIPANVTSIGNATFASCSGLTEYHNPRQRDQHRELRVHFL